MNAVRSYMKYVKHLEWLGYGRVLNTVIYEKINILGGNWNELY